ncbi:MAG: hypothetical protein IJ279_03200 [Clostridia bacterium]|nr:hypothetical protein [Clostridia bacterium]
MGSSIMLIFIIPIMLIDFIDNLFGTNLTSSIADSFGNAIDYFVNSGIYDKFANIVIEFLENLNLI